MEDPFVEHTRQHFFHLMQSFVTKLQALWPCLALEELQAEMDTMETEKMDMFIHDWHENLCNKVTSKTVKYAKAVERIVKDHATLYHVCEYNDIDGFEITSTLELFQRIGLFDKYRDGSMSDDDKKIFWRFVSELNELAFKYKCAVRPYVPTRTEIQQNIKTKKRSNGMPSMTKAFHNTLNALLKLTNTDLELDYDTCQSQWIPRWTSFVQDTVDNVKIPVLCQQHDFRALQKLGVHFAEFVNIEGSEEMWTHIVHLNGYSAVGENIPSQMMGKIENIATRLADDIVHGRKDFSSLNLSDIGQQVLSQCDENDMTQFANNIDNLLPALQSFSSAQGL